MCWGGRGAAPYAEQGGNGGSEGFEKVGPPLQVLGFEGAREGGDHLPGTFGAPVPLVGDVKSSPTARGRMLRLERKKQGGERLGRRRTCLEEDGGGTAPSDRWRTCWEGG